MMKWISGLVFITTLCAFTVLAQQPSPTPVPAKGPTYDDMVAKLKGGQTRMDYQTLRIAFTQTKAYSPFGPGRTKGGLRRI